MTETLADSILERLSRVRSMEADLADRVDGLRTSRGAGPEAADVVARMSPLAARHRHALEEIGRRGAETETPTARAEYQSKPELSGRLEELAGAVAAALVAYGGLYAAARLQYEIELCDLADTHAADWASELQAINDLVPAAVHAEMLGAGLTCQCLCPACSIGACGCTRNSIETMREYWGRPEVGPSEGLELRIPPRPGSQLSDAGLQQGDLVLAIDGGVVHTNSELQRALRSHPIGEVMQVQVERSGRTEEIGVARMSD
jgi:PDZ domain